MPRAKVKPQDRLRAAKACTRCKALKIRCDAISPCSTCVKRDRAALCIYPETTAQNDFSRQHADTSATASRSSDRSSNQDLQNTPPVTVDEVCSRGSSRRPSVSNDGAAAIPELKSHYLLSAKQQQVYVGETASLSFLHFVRKVVKHGVGPCAFTEDVLESHMLEVGIEYDDDNNNNLPQLGPENSESLHASFLAATSGVIFLYSPEELRVHAGQPLEASEIVDTTSEYLMLAIGAQCRGHGRDYEHASKFFNRARRSAFNGMLCDPSPAMVQHFLLMAFYMIGACHRNAAFMYLGVASKAASALGFHRLEQYRSVNENDCGTRLRIQMSLRTMNMIVNSILGRTGDMNDAALVDYGDLPLGPHSFFGQVAAQATSKLCPLMEELGRTSGIESLQAAEEYIRRLREWSRLLPEDLKQRQECTETRDVSQLSISLIGGTHVACAYYFANILVTRRFLTAFVLPRITLTQETRDYVAAPVEPQLSEMAYVCVDAAIHLANRAHMLMTSGMMAANMCMLKGWLFSGGLILGLALFAGGLDLEDELHEAIRQTLSVMERLALTSPLARRYHEILSAFVEAMALKRRKRSESMKQLTGHRLDEVFDYSAISNTKHSGSTVDMRNAMGEQVENVVRGLDGAGEPSTMCEAMPLNLPDLFTQEEWEAFAPFIDFESVFHES